MHALEDLKLAVIGMGDYVTGRMVKAMLKKGIGVAGTRVLVLASKENCPDVRNTRVIDVVRALEDYGIAVDVHDTCVEALDAAQQYGLALIDTPAAEHCDGIVLTVPHDKFRRQGAAYLRIAGKPAHVFFDMKSAFEREESDLRL